MCVFCILYKILRIFDENENTLVIIIKGYTTEMIITALIRYIYVGGLCVSKIISIEKQKITNRFKCSGKY